MLPSIDEQQKIANCLSSIDALIAAEADKLEALKNHKKGLIQQLFPTPGQTTPRLRFSEFKKAGEWEVKTIGNSSKSFSGGTPSTANLNYYGGTIPFIRSGEIDAIEAELTLTTQGLKNSSAKMVDVGDVLIAMYGDNSGKAAISKISGAINQAILCLRHETNNEFLYQYWCSRQEWVTARYLQGGQGNLSADIIKSVPIPTPHQVEQAKIAHCLSAMDRSVDAQRERLATLKAHKSGLVQQLFPAIDEVSA